MSRPLRFEFSGALYHVTSRGDRQGDIYRDDIDRLAWLETMSLVCARFNFIVHAFCQMTNHYHLKYEAKFANRDVAMAQAYLSTAYTMAQIGEHFGVSYQTVSRAVKSVEAAGKTKRPG